MRRLLGISVCLALACGGAAFAQWQRNGERLPDSDWSKSVDGLSAMLIMADNPDEVIDDWNTAGAEVTVHAARTITRGVPIVGFVFFAGCRPDDEGLCNAAVDFTVLRPDGEEYVRFADRELWKDKPAPPADTLRLAAEYVGVVIEPQDPLGEYEVLVSVRDLNAGTTLELKRSFTAVGR